MGLRENAYIYCSCCRGVKNVLTGKAGCHVRYRQLALTLRNSKRKFKAPILIHTFYLLSIREFRTVWICWFLRINNDISDD